MKLRTLTLIATIAALPTLAQEHEHGRVSPVGALSAKPRISSEAAVANPNAASRKNAEEFIGAVERELPIETEYGNRVSWMPPISSRPIPTGCPRKSLPSLPLQRSRARKAPRNSTASMSIPGPGGSSNC